MRTAALLLAVLSIGASRAAGAVDLLDVYRQAQANDPAWAAAQAGHRANLEQVPQARAGLLPSIDLSVDVFQNRQDVQNPIVDDTFSARSESYGLELTQPLYNRPNRAAYAQSQAFATQSEYQLAVARDDLIVRTVRAYLAVLTAREVHEYAQSEKAAVQRLLTLARRNFNVGTATLVDVHEAQAAYDLTVSQEIAAANELEVARESLQLLTGRPVGPLAGLAAKPELAPPEPAIMQRWVETAVSQNPNVRVREQVLEQTAQVVERSRGGHYPTLDLVLARSYNDTDAVNFLAGTRLPTETTTDQVGVRFNLPIYQGGGTSAQVREAVARYDEAQLQLEATRRQIAQQAREVYLAVTTNLAQVRSLEQARASNQRAVESTVLGQERGLRTGLDVLNNQRVLFRTLRDLARARYDYLLARVQLRAVAGTLSEEDLIAINRLLAVPK
jgi:outer membrane protein